MSVFKIMGEGYKIYNEDINLSNNYMLSSVNSFPNCIFGKPFFSELITVC